MLMLPSWMLLLQSLPPNHALALLLAEKMRRRCTNRVANYPPYAKQHAFHAMGATMRERLLILANQSGKTAVCLS
ncbi:terminase [Xylella fastidiosa subsp. pauca]|nr:terminase [Xylella fastidiosa subsp. pauca]TNW21894.1 terminase [Xylella fastidiosa subsp. pauca]TNW25949.1 terminase [Xylella fastidiosa subsp. pauca]